MPIAINDAGTIGGGIGSGGHVHAAISQDGQVTDLSRKLGLNGYDDVVTAINKAGVTLIAEDGKDNSSPNHYVLYDPGTGKVTDLNNLPGGAGKIALGLNGAGQVVGNEFLYQNGQFLPLPSRGGVPV